MTIATVAPEFKQLYARVLRAGIGAYLLTDRCAHTLLELGVDEVWDAFLERATKSAKVIDFTPGNADQHVAAIGALIEYLFITDHLPHTANGWSALVSLLADFAEWSVYESPSPDDFDAQPIIHALRQLGCTEDILAPFYNAGFMPALPAPAAPIHTGDAAMPLETKKPRLFIGSSKEGLPVAEAIHANLDFVCECVTWTHDVFAISETAIESLEQQLRTADFAVLVVTPDDVTESRDTRSPSPRDNVVFELGLFMGALGRKRTFVVRRRSDEIKLPSDLAGLTPATYEARRSDNDLLAALGLACTAIKGAIARQGKRTT